MPINRDKARARIPEKLKHLSDDGLRRMGYNIPREDEDRAPEPSSELDIIMDMYRFGRRR